MEKFRAILKSGPGVMRFFVIFYSFRLFEDCCYNVWKGKNFLVSATHTINFQNAKSCFYIYNFISFNFFGCGSFVLLVI